MSHHPKLLIAAHPTRGVDVGAQAQIWDQIREARREGLAVLLISADLDELIGLSDTLRVMYRGRLVADADPATITPEELGSAMTGAATGHLRTTRAGRGTGRGRGPVKKFDKDRLILALGAPLLALVAALVITSGVIGVTGKDPLHAFYVMIDFGSKSDSQVWIINKAIPYYLAAVAVAIGFRMNLFNIGVDGQYRVAAFFAAVVGGALTLPGFRPDPGHHHRRDGGRRALVRHRGAVEDHPGRQRGHHHDHAELRSPPPSSATSSRTAGSR